MKAHIWSTYSAVSRFLERAAATVNPSGAAATAATLAAGGRRSRRRASGSTMPAQTATQAALRSSRASRPGEAAPRTLAHPVGLRLLTKRRVYGAAPPQPKVL